MDTETKTLIRQTLNAIDGTLHAIDGVREHALKGDEGADGVVRGEILAARNALRLAEKTLTTTG